MNCTYNKQYSFKKYNQIYVVRCIPSTEETDMWRNDCTKMDFMWVYGLKIKKAEKILVSLFL